MIVTKKEAPAFEALRAAVDEAVAVSHAAPSGASTSLADELTKLQQMADTGVITQDELLAAKAKLLGR